MTFSRAALRAALCCRAERSLAARSGTAAEPCRGAQFRMDKPQTGLSSGGGGIRTLVGPKWPETVFETAARIAPIWLAEAVLAPLSGACAALCAAVSPPAEASRSGSERHGLRFSADTGRRGQ
jgi:hypothetical protein